MVDHHHVGSGRTVAGRLHPAPLAQRACRAQALLRLGADGGQSLAQPFPHLQ